MTFLELAEQVLKDEKKPLSAAEIWQTAIKKGYNKKLNSDGKTPLATLGAQIYVNSKDNPKSLFAQLGNRPKKFYLKADKKALEIASDEFDLEETKKKKYGYLEKDLHAHLSYYAYYHMRIYTKTIRHFHSTKKEFGEWVHPDIVGCYYPFGEWEPEVYELSAAIGNISIKLLSFEVKRELNFSNLRESFFQTVSNSSWANEGYLVAANISEDVDFRDELSRLSTSFGIGVIHLNLKDPNSTQTLLPAKYRDVLDWETINKLTMNKDFVEFLSRVKIDISSSKIHMKEYDSVVAITELENIHHLKK